MKFLIFSLLLGIVLGLSPEIATLLKKEPQILQPDEFWRVNGGYANDGEVFEVFYLPLNNFPQ